MLCSKFSFNMSVVQLADESVSPGLTCMHTDVHIILPMPFPPFIITADHSFECEL